MQALAPHLHKTPTKTFRWVAGPFLMAGVGGVVGFLMPELLALFTGGGDLGLLLYYIVLPAAGGVAGLLLGFIVLPWWKSYRAWIWAAGIVTIALVVAGTSYTYFSLAKPIIDSNHAFEQHNNDIQAQFQQAGTLTKCGQIMSLEGPYGGWAGCVGNLVKTEKDVADCVSLVKEQHALHSNVDNMYMGICVAQYAYIKRDPKVCDTFSSWLNVTGPTETPAGSAAQRCGGDALILIQGGQLY